MATLEDHPCGKCDNGNCNNGHAFDQNCPQYIEYERWVLARNMVRTRNEFAEMKRTSTYPQIENARIKKVS